MCAAAISFARVNHLYFGAVDEKGGAVVSGVKFYDSPTCHHRPQYTGGVCAEACGRLLKDFFTAKRQNQKIS
jgi:tRNA(Arg) A34 adenosine deaminase TadA